MIASTLHAQFEGLHAQFEGIITGFFSVAVSLRLWLSHNLPQTF